MAAADVTELAGAARAALAAGQVEEALTGYASATHTAREELAATDPVRIVVATEHAQVWFDHRDDPGAALRIAALAYDEAVDGIDDAKQHRAAVDRLGELRDHMTFWAFRMDG